MSSGCFDDILCQITTEELKTQYFAPKQGLQGCISSNLINIFIQRLLMQIIAWFLSLSR